MPYLLTPVPAPFTGDADYLVIIGVLAVTAIAIVAILIKRRKK